MAVMPHSNGACADGTAKVSSNPLGDAGVVLHTVRAVPPDDDPATRASRPDKLYGVHPRGDAAAQPSHGTHPAAGLDGGAQRSQRLRPG
jgi:hypothetical protein